MGARIDSCAEEYVTDEVPEEISSYNDTVVSFLISVHDCVYLNVTCIMP